MTTSRVMYFSCKLHSSNFEVKKHKKFQLRNQDDIPVCFALFAISNELYHTVYSGYQKVPFTLMLGFSAVIAKPIFPPSSLRVIEYIAILHKGLRRDWYMVDQDQFGIYMRYPTNRDIKTLDMYLELYTQRIGENNDSTQHHP